jgi:transcription factor E2F3
MVDTFIKELQIELQQMAKDPAYEQLAYLTFNDIATLNSDAKDTLIAVKAPLGSKIEMPDPDQLFQYFSSLGYSPSEIKRY